MKNRLSVNWLLGYFGKPPPRWSTSDTGDEDDSEGNSGCLDCGVFWRFWLWHRGYWSSININASRIDMIKKIVLYLINVKKMEAMILLRIWHIGAFEAVWCRYRWWWWLRHIIWVEKEIVICWDNAKTNWSFDGFVSAASSWGPLE